MQQEPAPISTGASSTTPHSAAPKSPAASQPSLPSRNVTVSTIEDAFVQFILHCNPAVPPETDTLALRDAFQTPPKSGGKSFDTFTLFKLIKQLESKEIKTWAELALKLGVDPPDQDKGQSSQKIQQYAVRLKRWMHAMHIDAFFDYLLEREGRYWTEIPDEREGSVVRDGVAAEDDMALRALLPHIRPKRGRRKPDDEGEGTEDVSKSPGLTPSIEPPPGVGGGDGLGGLGGLGNITEVPWSAHPDSRGRVFLFPVPADSLRLSAGGMGQRPGQPWSSSSGLVIQTPLTAYPPSAYPQSAITPSTRQAFWSDEPSSAVNPSKARINRRHGAKVVSSAWRSGLGGTGKTRGRPRINRVENGPFSAFPSTEATTASTFKVPPLHTPISATTASGAALQTLVESPVSMVSGSAPTTPVIHVDPKLPAGANSTNAQETQPNSRPAKRSRLSLQVPERVGGEVRLATPPPVVMVNGQAQPTTTDHHPFQARTASGVAIHSSPQSHKPQTQPLPFTRSHFAAPGDPASNTSSQGQTLSNPHDRTNKSEVESFFINEVVTASWFSLSGNPIPPCSLPEAHAIVTTTIENLLRSASSSTAFLSNLAALAGGKFLMGGHGLKITRLEEGRERNRYRCEWELRFGEVQGAYSMEETVECRRWKDTPKDGDRGEKDGGVDGREDEEGETEEKKWQRMYLDMCEAVKRRDKELADIKAKVVQALKDTGRD